MGAVSGNCERCIKLGATKWCSGNRTDCENILINTIEVLQRKNEQLRTQVMRIRETLEKAREAIQRAKENFEPYGEYEYDVRYDLEEALAEIDKAKGRTQISNKSPSGTAEGQARTWLLGGEGCHERSER